MQRVLEAELMTAEDPVKAHAEAVFSKPYNQFIQLIQPHLKESYLNSTALDSGCGSGYISC